jgi:membrane-bound lytic murein transglycosylase D
MNVFSLPKLLLLTIAITCKVALAQNEVRVDSLTLTPNVKIDSFKNAFVPLQSEYIPGDETPELISARLSSIEKSISLPFNNKVQAFIHYFTVRDRDYTRMILRRQQLYFPLFEKHLSAFNLPVELKYLSVIESGLNPHVISGARAVGLWQFMSATGKYFSLNNNEYEDDRMDPEKSTIAACKYLTQLYSIFHDWHLALAAYNSGPGTVSRAIKKAGNKRSFWEIYDFLPAETRSYVPQYIAMVYALNYAEDHNIIENYREQPLPSDTLFVSKYLHFETLANLTGTCKEDLRKLNPVFHNGVIPEGRAAIIRLPLLAKERLNLNRYAILDSASKVGRMQFDNLLKNAKGSVNGKELIKYRVRSGEALSTIATKFAVSLEDLKKWNNLRNNLIHPGTSLSIWILAGRKSAAISSAKIQTAIDKEGKMYTVKPGDTLWNITRKFEGLTIEKIKSLNKMKSVKLQPGQKLIIG